jgi:hypothetical protein
VWSNHTQFCLLSDTAGYRRGRIVVLQPFIRHRHGKIHSPGAATSSEPEWRFPLACAPKFRMELGLAQSVVCRGGRGLVGMVGVR